MVSDHESASEASDSDGEPDFEFYPGTGATDALALNVVNAPLPPLWSFRQAGGAARAGAKRPRSAEAPPARRVEAEAQAVAGRRAFRHAVTTRMLPSLRSYAPELIMISAGFDGADGDQGNLRGDQSGLDLHPEDFLWLTQELVPAFARCPTFPAAN
jgi:acetoin utilization deacetylase AcuC-like enzyme